MSRKRKILDILGMILGVLLMIVNGMLVGLEYMYHVGNEFYAHYDAQQSDFIRI